MEGLHACGVKLNALTEENFLIDDEKKQVWIINFVSATGHQCLHQPIGLHGVSPDMNKFGCPQLYQLMKKMDLWVDLGLYLSRL